MEEGQDLIHWSEPTEGLEAAQSDGHLRFVVVIGVVLGKLSVEPSSQVLSRGWCYWGSGGHESRGHHATHSVGVSLDGQRRVHREDLKQERQLALEFVLDL